MDWHTVHKGYVQNRVSPVQKDICTYHPLNVNESLGHCGTRGPFHHREAVEHLALSSSSSSSCQAQPEGLGAGISGPIPGEELDPGVFLEGIGTRPEVLIPPSYTVIKVA